MNVTNDDVNDFLEHFGVMGMKWGVRKAEKRAAKTAKKMAKADSKWEKNIYTTRSAIAVHNKTAETINPKLESFNKKHSKANLIDSPDSPASKKYIKEYNALVERETANAIREVHGTSPSGKKKAILDTSDPNQWKVSVVDADVKHAADEQNPDLFFNVDHDAQGFITNMETVEPGNELIQGDLLLDDFLAHYGVMGMKWGVRRKRSAKNYIRENARASYDSIRHPIISSKELGKQQRANPRTMLYRTTADNAALNKAVAARVQAKKSSKAAKTEGKKGSEDHEKAKELKLKGAKNLSNAELKALNQRLQLESQYKNLDPGKIKQGMKIAGSVAVATTTITTIYGFSKSPLAKDLAKVMTKR